MHLALVIGLFERFRLCLVQLRKMRRLCLGQFEARIELMSEAEEEQLRKARLALKDEIYKMLTEAK